jgi:hypothetical protein
VVLAGVIAVMAEGVGQGNIVHHLLGHRLLADALHLLSIWLIWKVSPLVIERYWPPPALPSRITKGDWLTGTRIAVTLTYAWNPLLLIEFGASGHNDALVVVCLLAAIWLHLKDRWRLAVFVLALASLVKLTALLFLPAYLWLLLWEKKVEDMPNRWREGAWRVTQALVIVVLIWVSLYGPFWDDAAPMHAFSASTASYSYNHSIGKLLVAKANEGVSLVANALNWQPAEEWTPGNIRYRMDAYVMWGLRALTAILIALAVWRARTFKQMVESWGWVMLIYLTVGALWFWPWYVSWLIVPVALLGPSRLWTATQILCVSSMTLYAIFPRLMPPFDELATWTGLFIMAPPLLYLLWSYWPRPVGVRGSG